MNRLVPTLKRLHYFYTTSTLMFLVVVEYQWILFTKMRWRDYRLRIEKKRYT